MMVGALFIPALILLTGFLLPVMRADAAKAQSLFNCGWMRAFLFVVIALSFFHWAHRFRYILFDLGLKGGRTAVAALCYGAAVAGTLVAAGIALHLI